MIWGKKYNVYLKPISHVCVGSGEEYQSYEYIRDTKEKKIYLLDDNKIMELIREGIIKVEDIDVGLKELLNIIKEKDILHRFKSAYIDNCNKLVIKKFYKTLSIVDDEKIEYIATIPASTIKGLIRSGYDSYIIKVKNKKIRYKYIRKVEKDQNNKSKMKYKLKGICNEKKLLDNNNAFENNLLEKNLDQLFSKIKVNDLFISEDKFLNIKKAHRYNRKKCKTVISSYYEAVDSEATFYGSIQLQDDESILMNAIKGLKELATSNIKVERKLLKEVVEKCFYEKLEEENRKEYQAVVKIGFGGLIGKTFVSYDEKSNERYDDEFLPYTILTTESSYKYGKFKKQKPMGWAVLTIKENKED
ncbi:hypothetical protein FQB35_03630 [Crassaminicella thermophila]|uniref:CRISPR type III A-associated protein Csm5 n=1 Tax=Crassaminicella thermophila TaxID=2599308 RepID=A0A5C0SC73_CRATE|nr:hypothetical protein [Crassaminicella thermophila]QEK11537.1 hypothetical protein FQB35_03630 [Crassaminicella thermophila]